METNIVSDITVNAIVFLAPMSAFDQTLVEAPDVNRLVGKFNPAMISTISNLTC